MGRRASGSGSAGEEAVEDYRLAYLSRQVSVLARKEVLGGRAKFGIFGDGKELAQVAMAKACRSGDWRSGYYRDQTWMFALGVLSPRQYFAQLYADADRTREPQTGGRLMNAHFATRFLDDSGRWKDQTTSFNSAADLSPTAAQMPKVVGLAYASTLYRELGASAADGRFSKGGDEVVWASIGNASTAEGPFWEAVNAVGVLSAPAVIVVYDDGYGISVPNQFQMVKENISAILEGFRRVSCPADQCDRGFDLHSVPAWDYPALLSVFEMAGETARRERIPSLVHVTDCTQPLGHSTSGSQERYKSPERLAWEAERDCLPRFRSWIEAQGVAASAELDALEAEIRSEVAAARDGAWADRRAPLDEERIRAAGLIGAVAVAPAVAGTVGAQLRELGDGLSASSTAERRDVAAALHRALVLTRGLGAPERRALSGLLSELRNENGARYGSELYSRSPTSALGAEAVAPVYSDDTPSVMGFELINAAFDAAFARDPKVVAFGEDVGALGDVNQGFRGLQEKYGPWRVSDTGIREATIVGQAIGLAMRGFRPIAEIQYLDYLLYALQILSDDLSTLRWRSAGGQQAPVIVRTRGHRLEGVWHSGSPMGALVSLLRGMYVLVPRDFTRAAGFYNVLLRSEDPALVVEPLNGYRRRERLPGNIGDIAVPLGVPEILRPGADLTIVTYGSVCRPVMEAAGRLAEAGVDAEVVDVQSLLPFDRPGMLSESLSKTSRVLFVDEDVPGGATAYMMRELLEREGGYELLDSPPRTLSAAPHRPAYGSDGDYWSKPNAESIFDAAYAIMRESWPAKYPALD